MRKNNKVFPYIVVLRKQYRFLVGFIGIIAGLIFILTMIIRIVENGNTRMINIPILIVALILFVQQFLLFKKGKKTVFLFIYLLSFITLLAIPPFQPLCFLFILLALLEKPASTPEEIGFSDEKIEFNGIFKRHINWHELSNVVLKDGIITLDFKNNKLIQKETDIDEDDDEYDVTEEEFNEYCRNMLSTHNPTPEN